MDTARTFHPDRNLQWQPSEGRKFYPISTLLALDVCIHLYTRCRREETKRGGVIAMDCDDMIRQIDAEQKAISQIVTIDFALLHY